ncbi:MAG: TIGR03790 family protein [Planctomycetes bacterium]|nr:TIGR03790 family protein [Planctomycetota bacterium]
MRRVLRTVFGLGLVVAANTAAAGPENLLLIADPANADSLHVANYYINARQLPDANVLFMTPTADNHAQLVSSRLPGLFGTLSNRAIDDHIDYILLSPPDRYRIPVSSTISDMCFPVTRFALASAYTMAFIADDVLAGMPVTSANGFYPRSAQPLAFDSSTTWLSGRPSTSLSARRYFIGAMLGYTGARGNSVQELLNMIDRSVAADGSRPAGTFYYMNNAADPARNVRVVQYTGSRGAVTLLNSAGHSATVLNGALPTTRDDCLGIMTGFSSTSIISADLTLMPGAFADHLTSYAGHFSNAPQTKMSEWIAKGASGSLGAVQEPCNYQGKFPHAYTHFYYAGGATLGESYFRAAQYVPFQMLLYGDPITRPFAHIPAVSVPNAPTSPVAGSITLSPIASTTHPTASIASLELLIDGVVADTVLPGSDFILDTTRLSDGRHDVRVIAYDDTTLKTRGRWIGDITVNNLGRTATMGVGMTTGDLGSSFIFDLVNPPGGATEIRLTHAGRVVAAVAGGGAVSVYGRTLGAGPARLTPEALYPDGSIVRGEPVIINITPTGATTGAAPIAYSATAHVLDNQPFMIQLPATFDDNFSAASFTLATQPTKSTLVAHSGASHATFQPGTGAVGTDQLTYTVTTTGGTSTLATVTIVYTSGCYADCDKSSGVGTLDIFDFLCFQNSFVSGEPYACECDPDPACDIFDFLCFQNSFVAGCP